MSMHDHPKNCSCRICAIADGMDTGSIIGRRTMKAQVISLIEDEIDKLLPDEPEVKCAFEDLINKINKLE